MSFRSNSRNSLMARFGVALAGLSAWLIVPAALAQYSSSAETNQNFESLVQDQYPNQGGYPRQGYNYHHQESVFSHIAVEAGGGFTAPVGSDHAQPNPTTGTYPSVTWGGNVTLGAGWNFNKWFSTLAEWQLNDNKIPGATINYVIGAPNDYGIGGHVHTWSLTLQPTVYYKTTGRLGGYVFGGGGFYRKVTTFTIPVLQEECFYFCEEGYVNETLTHFSSNQGGWNVGTGVTWKAFGEDSNTKLYGEVRYVLVNSPAYTPIPGYRAGNEGLLPVTFGVRW
jgi:hypothetical protein